MTKAITEIEFLQEFNEQSNGEYILLSDYVKYLQKVKMKHLKCNNEYHVTPSDFIKRKTRCPKCANNNQLTHEEFIYKIRERFSDEYQVIGQFKSITTKLIFKHKKCGFEWETSPRHFINSANGCVKCNKTIKRKSTEYFKQEIFELVGDEYIVLGEYKGKGVHIELLHNKCSRTWNVDPCSFLVGTRCPFCNGGLRKSIDEFKNEVFSLVGNSYEVLGEYKNNITRIEIKHNECNQISLICPVDFLEGVRCLHCKLSRGEHKIKDFLINNNVNFITQKIFDNCIYKRHLPFDFAILKDDKIICLIEYDGQQHFEPVKFGKISDENAKQNFKNTRIRDKIKDDFCKENNIPLLRIPYWEYENIEEILKNELLKYKSLIS